MGSCKTCTCASLRRRPTPPTKRNTVRNKKAGDARKASEWITEDVTCSWRNSKRASSPQRALWSPLTFPRGLGWTRFGGSIENLKIVEGKKEKSLEYVLEIAKCCRLWKKEWSLRIYDRTFFEKGNGMKNLEGGDYLWKNLFHFDWTESLITDYFAWMIEGFFENLEIVERERRMGKYLHWKDLM